MAHHFSNALCGLGHEVVFLGPQGTYVPADYPYDYGLVEDWESTVRTRSGPQGIIQDGRIEALVTQIIGRYDIEQVLLFHPFYYGIGVLDAARRAGIGSNLYFHGFELRSQLVQGVPKDLSRLVRERRVGTLRERTLYLAGAVDQILVNSSYTASLLDPMGARGRTMVTGCGIPSWDAARERGESPDYECAARRHRRERLGMPTQPMLGYVGRLIEAKRVDRLIRIVAQHRGLSAVLIGTGPAEDQLRELTAQLGVEDRVHFEGSVSETRKWELLRCCDFAGLLSEPNERTGQIEGFGIALLEAAAAGAVPVTSGSGGMVDVVADSLTGLVLPADDAAAAQLLSSAVSDESRMRSLVDGARRQLDERFTWAGVAGRVAECWA